MFNWRIRLSTLQLHRVCWTWIPMGPYVTPPRGRAYITTDYLLSTLIPLRLSLYLTFHLSFSHVYPHFPSLAFAFWLTAIKPATTRFGPSGLLGFWSSQSLLTQFLFFLTAICNNKLIIID